ncbi:flagellar export chaperone FliS [Variovorax sp. J2P1-59]|uniref:flagellar export chaperone FliS n=1 Tax=Variovorax flavidus TaxID=3053501 RepID=UPI002576443F|nr:flagellar export chaperone FliS [Variovorax sp. J2P1-59]MDM0074580.1 flagellar export chaperone FliS [Variovorax sp. J2P1-59]
MYTPHTFRTGAGAYARVGVESGVMSATPHQLVCMLFDGAHMAIGMARHHMAQRDIEGKGNAISRAVNIVDNGLKAGLDAKAAGPAGEELVGNLTALYDYIIQRLLYANLRNDAQALDEADGLLDNIASAWREIDAGAARV